MGTRRLSFSGLVHPESVSYYRGHCWLEITLFRILRYSPFRVWSKRELDRSQVQQLHQTKKQRKECHVSVFFDELLGETLARVSYPLTPSTGALALAYLFNPFIKCISESCIIVT